MVVAQDLKFSVEGEDKTIAWKTVSTSIRQGGVAINKVEWNSEFTTNTSKFAVAAGVNIDTRPKPNNNPKSTPGEQGPNNNPESRPGEWEFKGENLGKGDPSVSKDITNTAVVEGQE